MQKILILLISTLFIHSAYPFVCDYPPSDFTQVIKQPLKEIPMNALPANFTWQNVNGTNYLTLVRNQFIPNWCGSCWAHAATSALSDRIKIMRRAQWPEINISPQVIISCERPDKGCWGGSHLQAYQWIYNYTISDETCSPYRARGWTNGLDCSDAVKCSTCNEKGCTVPESYPIYEIAEYGFISHSELAMMNEIYQRGPIACSVYSVPFGNYTSGMVNDSSGITTTNHAVAVVGWGTYANGTKYWIVRNSFGHWWGEDGFFKIIRGVNNLGIENGCSWAVPKDTWTNQKRNYTNTTNNPSPTSSQLHTTISNYLSQFSEFIANKAGFLNHLSRQTSLEETDKPEENICYKPDQELRSQNVQEVAPFNYIDAQSLPKDWDWRSVNGRNYLSWTKNEHAPQFCAGCWAEAATSALGDRINIAKNDGTNRFALSAQSVINCAGGGTCKGGDPVRVYEFARSHGIPEESCQHWVAEDPSSANCSEILVCKNCVGPSPPPGKNSNCSAVIERRDYKLWKVSSYGLVSGVEAMKKAIYAHGPITCAIEATEGFKKYSGGIYQELVTKPKLNHAISVVGWGTTDRGVQYWVARNSWGTYWGEWGFFRIIMGGLNLGIESDCSWAIPIVDS